MKKGWFVLVLVVILATFVGSLSVPVRAQTPNSHNPSDWSCVVYTTNEKDGEKYWSQIVIYDKEVRENWKTGTLWFSLPLPPVTITGVYLEANIGGLWNTSLFAEKFYLNVNFLPLPAGGDEEHSMYYECVILEVWQ
jgi:hypothetical protein